MEPTNFRNPARWNSVPVPPRVANRAVEKIDVDGNGCWISRYSVASHGYAQIGWNDGPSARYVVLAHRAAWVARNGQVPLGMTLDHICKTRRCVNPDHLRLLPNYENARRTFGDDWPMGYCKNGHPASEMGEHNAHLKSGKPYKKRYCRTCVRASRARYVERKKRENES